MRRVVSGLWNSRQSPRTCARIRHQATSDFMCVVVRVIFEICNWVKLSYLLADNFCKWSANPITNPNPVHSHYNTRDNLLQELQNNENCTILCILSDVKPELIAELVFLCLALSMVELDGEAPLHKFHHGHKHETPPQRISGFYAESTLPVYFAFKLN
jgi:hypothetical protein